MPKVTLDGLGLEVPAGVIVLQVYELVRKDPSWV
jgi:hypothetical protein